MFKLPLFTWVGNAAAALCGKHGDVTRQAEESGCSRQSVYDHAAKVEKAVADAHGPGPSREQLLQQIAGLRKENQELWDAYLRAVDFPEAIQQQFAATASAMGLSLAQTLVLLAILLPASRRPSRATLGRWVNQSARRAGRLLTLLDKAARSLVVSLCLDEIFFHRKPVLMGVEPHSLAWVLGQRTADRSGETWAKALAGWPNVQDVAVDGGTGLQRGLEIAAQNRQQAAQESPDARPAVRIHTQLDVFHTRRDGQRALRHRWQHAEALWDEAVKIERAKERFDRTGVDGRKFSQRKVNKAWRKTIMVFEQVCREEQAWQRACAALQVFRPDGLLNDRAWAQAELQAAMVDLRGSAWAKVCRQLKDERTLTFLDRLHGELKEAEPDPERRTTLVALWQWRRASRQAKKANVSDSVEAMQGVLQELLGQRLGKDGKEAYRRVSRVLAKVMRASSAVECVNSVVRMHQSRHKNLTQELLDLKRLFWNCRGFVEGKRKNRCPYQLLGLKLPSYDPWTLLQLDPAHLEQLLSSSGLPD
jgi:hypothetical protein